MIDIKKLEKAWKIFRDSNPYEICDGKEFQAIKEPEYCMGQMIEDTIAVLKEREAVEPYVDGEGNYCCKVCDTVVGWEELAAAGLIPYVYKFCPMCGRAVKRE